MVLLTKEYFPISLLPNFPFMINPDQKDVPL
jgi:hypothetical protein